MYAEVPRAVGQKYEVHVAVRRYASLIVGCFVACAHPSPLPVTASISCRNMPSYEALRNTRTSEHAAPLPPHYEYEYLILDVLLILTALVLLLRTDAILLLLSICMML